MLKIETKLTVFFDDPFWVGVYERISGGKLEVCKITFGPEPKEYEVYTFLLENWEKLRFGPPVAAGRRQDAGGNPKRVQRAIRKQLEARGVGTKAQEAMKLSQGEGKEARKKRLQLAREQEKERRFSQRQEKKKAKHRGH